MDYNQMIEQALNGSNVNPLLNTTIPPINTGQALLPPTMVADSVRRALVPGGAPLTDDNKDAAMVKIGMALAKPRMPGESVAGNFTAALDQGSESLQKARIQNQNVAAQQADLATKAQAVDTQDRVLNAKLQELAGKYPMEVAEMQQKLRQLALEGKTKEYEAIKAMIMLQPENVVKEIQNHFAQQEAQTRGLGATADFHEAYARFLDRGGKDKIPAGKNIIHSTKTDNGDILNTYVMSDGKGTQSQPYYELIRPGVSDPVLAAKMAEKELRRTNSYGWFGGPTPQEINAKAAEMMKPQIIHFDSNGQSIDPTKIPMPGQITSPVAAGAPTKGGTGPDAGFPANETPQQRIDRAGEQLKLIQMEIDQEKNPENRAALEKERDRLQQVVTSANPQTVARAVNPASVKKPVEVWTPDKINNVLGKDSGVQSSSDPNDTIQSRAVDAAKAKYEKAQQDLKALLGKSGLSARQRNATQIAAARKAVADALVEFNGAQKMYEDSVGPLPAVTGRTVTK